MIFAFLVGAAFYRSAQRRNLMPWLWAIIGFLSWIGGQFFAGIVLAINDPSILEGDEMDLLVPAIIGSVVTSVLMFIILELVGKNKNKMKDSADDSLLDDRYLENL